MAATTVNNFEVPNWAGKPPNGLHLDVLKDGKMIQKLMIDEKKCYFFGRNKQLCDFCIDHASSSRVHAALIWHKFLERPFIIDLGSTHGTFIGNLRLESKKPQQVPLDSIIHFGASTRTYIIRERPQAKNMNASEFSDDLDNNALPENEVELDNLTEFNTAHNRRIANVGDLPDTANLKRRKRKLSSHVFFNDEEEIINPEDVDPSIGRFRNMVHTVVIPKKAKMGSSNLENSHHSSLSLSSGRRLSGDHDNANPDRISSIAERVGFRVNVAPEVNDISPTISFSANLFGPTSAEDLLSNEPRKKKYAKEAWPGKKPTHGHPFLG